MLEHSNIHFGWNSLCSRVYYNNGFALVFVRNIVEGYFKMLLSMFRACVVFLRQKTWKMTSERLIFF